MLVSILLSIALAAGPSVSAPTDESLWLNGEHATMQSRRVLEALGEAQVHGLRPDDYAIGLPANEVTAVLTGGADARTRQRFAIALSRAASRFITDLHDGRVDPRSAGFQLPISNAKLDVQIALSELASSPNVALTLASFEPTPTPYKRLKGALAGYRRLAQKPGLTRLPALPARSITTGDAYVGTPQLRGLLTAVGELHAHQVTVQAQEHVLDAATVEAIRSFQRRHGLEADGVVGPQTFAALTTPLAARVRQIELSMERWRWLTSTGRPNIVINVPQFMLFALPRSSNAFADVLEMRIIVGEEYPHTRTPVFTSRITQVVFQPYWDVPRSILLRELLPRIRADQSFLERHHMEIVQGESDYARVMEPSESVLDALGAGRLRLRQRPGPGNALGPVKFVMPNPFNVYLHATPEQVLFDRAQRTFSHGCVRVSEPAALAAYVLENAHETWDSNRIDAALCGTKTLRISLKVPVEVIVFYATAVATESGAVLFFGDVYGHDRRLQTLLDNRSRQTSRTGG